MIEYIKRNILADTGNEIRSLSIQERIKDLRVERKLTLEQLADLTEEEKQFSKKE